MKQYQLRSQFHRILSEKQDTISAQPAIIGDENGNVMVDGEGNQVWVQIAGLPATTAFNTRVAARWGEPVWVGYDPVQPGVLQVLGVRFGGRYGEDGEPTPATVLAHHSNHEWLGGESGSGGEDVVFSDLRQLMPLRVSATGSMGIGIHGNTNLKQDRSWQDFAFSTLDMTAYAPTGSAGSSGSAAACLALISLDANGSPAVTTGSPATLATLSIGDLPDLPDYHRPLAVVRLYAGQTEILETRQRQDIADLRWNYYDPGHYILKHLVGSGSPGQVVGVGSGSNLVFLDIGEIGGSVSPGAISPVAGEMLLGNAGTGSGSAGEIPLADGLGFTSGSLAQTESLFDMVFFDVEGAIAEATSAGGRKLMPLSGEIDQVWLYLVGLGSAGSTIIDINIDGNSIFTDPADRPSLAYSASGSVASSGSGLGAYFGAGSIVTMDIDSVSTCAAGLAGSLKIVHLGGGNPGEVLTDDDSETLTDDNENDLYEG